MLLLKVPIFVVCYHCGMKLNTSFYNLEMKHQKFARDITFHQSFWPLLDRRSPINGTFCSTGDLSLLILLLYQANHTDW